MSGVVVKYKQCYTCKNEYPATKEYFHHNKINKGGLSGSCKSCKREYSKRNPRRIEQSRQCNLKQKFGITLDQYDQMFEIQGGVCAICGNVETHKNHYGIVRLSVDHNHKTGKIRGLLCNNCNTGLGHFKEDPGLMLKATNYIIEAQGE